MRILVIGAGATGGFFGGKLALAGRDVTFLVREHRAAQLRRTGVILREPESELALPQPKILLASELAATAPFDLILLSVKAYSLASAIEDFAPAVGPSTAVLPVLNGMQHLDALDARFGRDRILGGFTRISADLDSEGRVLRLTGLKDLHYGERNGSRSPRILAIDAQLRDAGFEAQLSPDIVRGMWMKWVILAGINGINLAARGSVGQVVAVDSFDGIGTRLANAVVSETVAVATACGYTPSPQDESTTRRYLTEPGSKLESSLYRDLRRGGAVESEQILGDMIRRAREKSVATPLLEAAYVQLKIYEASRANS